MIASTVSTFTSSPSSARMSAIVPLTGAATSSVALSVSTSTSGLSGLDAVADPLQPALDRRVLVVARPRGKP